MRRTPYALLTLAIALLGRPVLAQPFGAPDRGKPGDAMIQEYLRRETAPLHDRFLDSVETVEDWRRLRPRYEQEYLYMLGLWPLPEKTPLRATVTGTLAGAGYVVEMVHYQSMAGLYVTGNLYRPAEVAKGERLPAVLYVCGHTGRGRDGVKTAYQSQGIWFARHGYVCLVVDTLQLGEIAALHHGTYREERWWWHSRGYTPAGVECWNGVRGIDYLIGRPDVDAERIAVTGISGGGAATFWIAAADERVKVAVPVSGMADLPSYVPNRVINGHCDCMFLYNAFGWPWTRIAALVAPRPLLFVNSDADRIFPMDANERVINRLERLYALFGAGDLVDSVVSVGGHAYRRDIRQAAYRFINTHLKNDPRPVTDSEDDLVTGTRREPRHPIAPSRLRVFATNADLPKDQLNSSIDQHFVPVAKVEVPKKGEFGAWKKRLLAELRRVVFRSLPDRVPAAKVVERSTKEGVETICLETEPGIVVTVRAPTNRDGVGNRQRVTLSVDAGGESFPEPESVAETSFRLRTRGVGRTEWTRRNPPNYVERSHALLGSTVDTGRVRDVIAVARWLAKDSGLPVHVSGMGRAGIIVAYAALLEPEIAGAVLLGPALSHMDPEAPQFLNVLRVADVPETLGMLAPKPLQVSLRLSDSARRAFGRVAEIYEAAGAEGKLTVNLLQ